MAVSATMPKSWLDYEVGFRKRDMEFGLNIWA
jgi:hypothetical protein